MARQLRRVRAKPGGKTAQKRLDAHPTLEIALGQEPSSFSVVFVVDRREEVAIVFDERADQAGRVVGGVAGSLDLTLVEQR